MKKFYAYIRVSTQKQGEKGVSLQEQQAAIKRYAERNQFKVVQWFEERVTAAKWGRPLFTKMVRGLRAGHADGLIIHKIDRGARNLRDWADIGELIDAGVSVHFANESIDLLTRGGRLSADIQAVVAADYIRNLREETLKGIRGRLNQGLYPFGAPVGYLNCGSGKTKDIDAVRGPLVREAFELYASGGYTLKTLRDEMRRRGLAISLNGLSIILNNPFYAGVIRIKTTNETYQGAHPTLISMDLFREVRSRLHGRFHARTSKHDFTFRGLFECALCKRSLIGEIQKGHVYYRCHTTGCPTRSFREETLTDAVLGACPPVSLSQEQQQELALALDAIAHVAETRERDQTAGLHTQLSGVQGRLARLVDAYLDGSIEKESFATKKQELLEEERLLRDSSARLKHSNRSREFIADQVALVCNAREAFAIASTDARREMALLLCSNRKVSGKKVVVEPCIPLADILKDVVFTGGVPQPGGTRTTAKSSSPETIDINKLARELWKWAEEPRRMVAKVAA